MPSYRETGSSSRSRMKADMMLPSTSKAHSSYKKDATQSPVSPVGRIAKRNAIKLNEVDLSGRTSVYSENFAGMIPLNLDASNLDEKFPIISKILDCEDSTSTISAENFNALQKAIEELLAENVDNQKTIYGEITYMNTGEYPTIQLSDRPMPSYLLRPKTSTETSKRTQTDESLLADLGLNSSPEEEDEDQPSILDVPQRFWNWSREYLRHITEEYLLEFKVKIVDRFSDQEIQKYLSKDYTPNKPLESSEIHRSHKKICTPRLNGARGALQTPQLSKGRIKRRPAFLIEETMPIPKLAKRESSRGNRTFAEPSSSKIQSLVSKVIRTHQASNGITPKSHHSIGIEMEANDDEEEEWKSDVHLRLNGTYDQKFNGFHLTPLSNGTASKPVQLDSSPELSPTNIRHKSEDLRSIGKALASLGVQKGILPKKIDECLYELSSDEKVFEINGNNNLVMVEEENEDLTDEVSRELRKKQKELADLYNKTKPVILELYERIQAEYALYETSRRLDITDDKMFELGAKYERLHSLNKEQRQESKIALEAREKAVHQFYRLRQPTSTNHSNKPNTPNRKQSQNFFD